MDIPHGDMTPHIYLPPSLTPPSVVFQILTSASSHLKADKVLMKDVCCSKSSSQQCSPTAIITLHPVLFHVHFHWDSACTHTHTISSTACCFSLFIGSDAGSPASRQPGRPIAHPAHLQGPPHPLIYNVCFCCRPGVSFIWNRLQGWLSLSGRIKAIGLQVQTPTDLLFRVSLNRQRSLCWSPQHSDTEWGHISLYLNTQTLWVWLHHFALLSYWKGCHVSLTVEVLM